MICSTTTTTIKPKRNKQNRKMDESGKEKKKEWGKIPIFTTTTNTITFCLQMCGKINKQTSEVLMALWAAYQQVLLGLSWPGSWSWS